MEHSGARPPRLPHNWVLALEAPNTSATRSLHNRGRSGRAGSGGRSASDSMQGRGGRSGGVIISSRGVNSKHGRGLSLPTAQKRNLLLKEKRREIVHIDLATISTSRNNSVALTPKKNIADQGLPVSNPTVIIRQSEGDEIEAFTNAPAPEPEASAQADPSIEPTRSGKADKAILSLKSIEPID